MIEILIGKIQRPFFVHFIPASLLGVAAATRAENSREWIGNDWNSDGERNRSQIVADARDALYGTTS
jgi:hypothetical protein